MVPITLDDYEPLPEILNFRRKLPHFSLIVAAVFSNTMLQRPVGSFPRRLPPASGSRTDQHVRAAAGECME